MTTNTKELFFELLKVSVGVQDQLTRTPSTNEWEEIMVEAEQQSIVGVMLDGLERLPEGQRPQQLLLLQWIGEAQMDEQNTLQLVKAGEQVVAFFRQNSFACTLLKGAAVGRYYPKPERRTSGDIDVWVDGGREKIYEFARKFDKDGKLYGVNYHHIHFRLIDDVHIEVHIWPSFLSSPLRNNRLHKFCNLYRPTYETDKPSLGFDRVFIMLHCYRHICGHGLGLRQIMDYYYVLKASFKESHEDNEGSHRSKSFKNLNQNYSKEDAVYWIKKLGMERFARGLMWVLKEYFGLEEKFLLMEPDEKEGQFIIQEVMLTGNMGHSDTRNWGSKRTPLSRFFLNLKRDIYMVRHCPHEALWQPFFSIWLYAWRWSKGLFGSEDND